MKSYLVGGAVRDQLLGLPVIERDWVVVGATIEQMLSKGFRPIGKDFPVFLHPTTHEEYALARTERKVARGYQGFEFYADPSVGLEEDLERRDLTINAIAQDSQGQLIDPFFGLADIESRQLRHVSAAFSEDPVRILRLARFAARFDDFSVHPETLLLAQKMTESGEVDALVTERVWAETAKALEEAHAWRFFQVLLDCGALLPLFGSLSINDEAIARLKCTATAELSAAVRWAVVVMGCPVDVLSMALSQLKCPKAFAIPARLVAAHRHRYSLLPARQATDFFELLRALDVFRRPEHLSIFSTCCAWFDPSLDHLKIAHDLSLAFEAATSVDVRHICSTGVSGVVLGRRIAQARLQAIKVALSVTSV